MTTFQSAEIVQTSEGRQYHTGCAPEDIAPYILLTGDPQRAHRVATYLTDARPPICNREYVTITGKYQGIPTTVMATGMGPDNTEMALIELAQLAQGLTFIRIGSSGALRKGIELGDLVISEGAVRLENTSTYFVHEGYPAVPSYQVTLALLEAAQRNGFPHHLGLTATAPGFYGAQARRVPGFPLRQPELPAQLDAMRVSNMEMECSALFTIGYLAQARTGAVCAIYANRHANQFIDDQTKDLAEQRCLETGLAAVEILHGMDQKRGRAPHWLPSMGM